MRLACPVCGALASIEAWAMDEEARKALLVLAGLPGGLGKEALRYLGLFRKPESKRGLAWPKVLRLAEELAELVAAPEVTWKAGAARAATPAMWLEAIREVMDRVQAGKLALPLESHGYLRSVAYSLADKADARDEKAREATMRHPQARPQPADAGPQRPNFEGMAGKAQAWLDRNRGQGGDDA